MLNIGKYQSSLGLVTSYSVRHRFDAGVGVLRFETGTLFSRIGRATPSGHGQNGYRADLFWGAEAGRHRAIRRRKSKSIGGCAVETSARPSPGNALTRICSGKEKGPDESP